CATVAVGAVDGSAQAAVWEAQWEQGYLSGCVTVEADGPFDGRRPFFSLARHSPPRPGSLDEVLDARLKEGVPWMVPFKRILAQYSRAEPHKGPAQGAGNENIS